MVEDHQADGDSSDQVESSDPSGSPSAVKCHAHTLTGRVPRASYRRE